MLFENIPNGVKICDEEISDVQEHLKNAQIEVKKPFTKMGVIRKPNELKELDMLLSTDGPKELE